MHPEHEKEYYELSCARCRRADKPLCIMPHRREGKLVGLLFACNECWEKLRNGLVTIESVPD